MVTEKQNETFLFSLSISPSSPPIGVQSISCASTCGLIGASEYPGSSGQEHSGFYLRDHLFQGPRAKAAGIGHGPGSGVSPRPANSGCGAGKKWQAGQCVCVRKKRVGPGIVCSSQ